MDGGRNVEQVERVDYPDKAEQVIAVDGGDLANHRCALSLEAGAVQDYVAGIRTIQPVGPLLMGTTVRQGW